MALVLGKKFCTTPILCLLLVIGRISANDEVVKENNALFAKITALESELREIRQEISSINLRLQNVENFTQIQMGNNKVTKPDTKKPKPPSNCSRMGRNGTVALYCILSSFELGDETKIEIYNSKNCLVFNDTSNISTPYWILNGLVEHGIPHRAIVNVVRKAVRSDPIIIEGIQFYNKSELVAPSPPKFDRRLEPFRESEQQPFSTNCSVTGGFPAPMFIWSDGEGFITNGLGPLKESVSGGVTTYSQELQNRTFTFKSSRRFLRCTVYHEALSVRDNIEALQAIEMKYSPRVLEHLASKKEAEPSFDVVVDLKDRNLTVAVWGNPSPNVTWYTEDEGAITEGEVKGKYHAFPVEGNPFDDRHLASLGVNVTGSQKEMNVGLAVENSEGARNYTITVLYSESEGKVPLHFK